MEKTDNGKIKLSIIVPYFETFDLTMKLLRELSLQRNGNDEIEIIVVDDYCKNEFSKIEVATDDILLKGMITVINHEKNIGVAKSRNEGIELAKGKYIAFIDCDDMITPNYIDTLLNAINTYGTDIINFNWLEYTQNKVWIRPSNYAPWKAIYKKETMLKFREDREYGAEDVDFQEEINKKIINKEYTITYLDRVLYIYNDNREGSLYWKKTHKEVE